MMAKEPRFRADGEPDGRGHAEGSFSTRFGPDDGRRRPGRPRGAKSLKAIYLAAAAMPVTVKGKRGVRKLTTVEGIVLKQREKALSGDQRAAERFLDKVAEHSPIDVEPDRTAELLAEDAEIIAGWEARHGAFPGAVDGVDEGEK